MMSRMTTLGLRKRHPQVGARPGTLVVDDDSPPTVVRIMSYTPERVDEQQIEDVSQLERAHDSSEVTWVNVEGFGNEQTIRQIGELFQLHPLALEDVVNVPQRPKCEAYGDQLFVIVRMAYEIRPTEIMREQVTVVIGKNYVITFQERLGDVLEPVRERIRLPTSRLRASKADYLAYVILDTIVDAYYPLLESLGEHLESLETRILDDPRPKLIRELNDIRHTLLHLRRAAWPQREAINNLLHEDSLLSEQVCVYLRDTYDHCIQTAEVLEMYREMASGLMNTYLSSVANRANDVMKTLTVVASIFIPLTFVAGIYGMNFDHMPELHYRWAYPLVWSVMGSIVLALLFYYRRKGWLGG